MIQPPDRSNQGPAAPGGPDGQGPRFGWLRRNLIWILLLAVVPWLIFLVWQPSSIGNNAEPVSYTAFVQQVQAGNVSSVTLSDNSVTGTFKTLEQHGVKVVVSNNSSNIWIGLLQLFLPVLLLIGGIWWLSRRAASAQGGIFSFGQSRAKMYMGGKTKTTFADVAGVDEAKVDLEEVVDFLKNPARYSRLGGKLPKGVLLVGPPGTGKTLLAKAVAGEADVPFFSMSGSEFVEMLVGVGASRVRDLFDRAKKAAPCLNQILVEMDGFDPRQAVIVLAATNRPDVLDPALLRPGRFDRQVVVDRPDRPGREAIFHVHTRGLPLGPDVDLGVLARATPGMVGADIANVCNEAALLAARRNENLVTMQDFEDAIDRIMMGAQRPLLLSPEERKVIAYHEGGHALVALLTPHSDPVRKVTIVPRGQALGVTQIMPLDDRHNYPRNYLLTRIAVGLGGRVAEEVAIGEITTGAENDFQNVTNLAREMVMRWGMSERIGTVFFGHDRDIFLGREMSMGSQREFSEATAAAVDEEVQRIIGERYRYVEELLLAYRPVLDEIARRLLEKEVLEEAELRALLANVPREELERIVARAGANANGHASVPTGELTTENAESTEGRERRMIPFLSSSLWTLRPLWCMSGTACAQYATRAQAT